MEFPIKLRREVIKYSLGLFIASSYLLRYKLNLENILLTLIGMHFSLIIRRSKFNCFIGNIFLLLSFIYNNKLLYFFSYGYIICNTYSSIMRLCLSDFRYECYSLCFTLECMGLFSGIFINMKVALLLCIFQFINICFLSDVPIETPTTDKKRFLSDVYKKITYLLGETSYILLSKEYKKIVEMYYKQKTDRDYRLGYAILNWSNFFIPLLFINIPFYLKISIIIGPMLSIKKYNWCNYLAYCLILSDFYILALPVVLFCDWIEFIDSDDKIVLSIMIIIRYTVSIFVYIFMIYFLGFKPDVIIF